MDYFRRLTIIGTIIKLEEMSSSPSLIDFHQERDSAKKFINDYKVKYIVIHKTYFDSPIHQYLSEIIPVDIFHEDKNHIGYKRRKDFLLC